MEFVFTTKSSHTYEAILLEMDYNNKKSLVPVIYRSPSQNNEEFDTFLTNFQKLLNEINNLKPPLSIITGDFNARSSQLWSKDINTTEASKLFSGTSSNGFSELINEPTHIQTNSSFCIDLIFTDQSMLSVNSEVHTSLFQNCQHKIVLISIFTTPTISTSNIAL